MQFDYSKVPALRQGGASVFEARRFCEKLQLHAAVAEAKTVADLRGVLMYIINQLPNY